MSEPTTPPPAPPAPEKKGLSPLAWVLIGCLGLILVAMLAVGACTMFAAKKIKDVAGDFEDNPALAAAEMVVRVNPELELVESDPDAGTLTIRNVETGEVVTVGLDEVQEGRIRFESDGEETTIGISGDEDDGTVTITGADDTTVRFGAGADAGERPDWAVVYPGSEATTVFAASVGGNTSGTFHVTTDDSVADVMAFYEEELERLGFAVQTTTHSGTGSASGSVSGESADPQRTVVAVVTTDQGQTQAVVTYSEGG